MCINVIDDYAAERNNDVDDFMDWVSKSYQKYWSNITTTQLEVCNDIPDWPEWKYLNGLWLGPVPGEQLKFDWGK